MKPPIELTGPALEYWRKHFSPLRKSGVITDRDLHSFSLLCKVWGMLQSVDATPGAENYRAMIQFTNLAKQYQSLASQFGLLPRDRRHSKLDNVDTGEVDEFGIPL